MSEANRYRITGLSQLDIRRLQAAHPGKEFVVETPKADEGRHSELATLAIIGGLTLLGQAAAYYFGKSKKEKIILAVQEIRPDGSIRIVNLELHRSSTEPIESQIVKALNAGGG